MALSKQDRAQRNQFLRFVANDIVCKQLEAMGYIREDREVYKKLPLYDTLIEPLVKSLDAICQYYEEATLALAPTLN